MAADTMREKGMTLIELAMAVFVIAVGITGVLAVARSAQRAQYDTVAELRTTEFARNAMTTLQLFSDRAAEDPDPTAWIRFWADFSSGEFPISQMITDAFTEVSSSEEEADQTVTLYGDNTFHTNSPAFRQDRSQSSDGAFIRYRMSIAAAGNEREVTYAMTNNPPPFIGVTLHTFYGNSTGNGSTFYGIFANKGKLP